MARHHLPAGELDAHEAGRGCPCGPTPVVFEPNVDGRAGDIYHRPIDAGQRRDQEVPNDAAPDE